MLCSVAVLECLRAHFIFALLQVRNTTEGEVSVPITWTYNHHYGPKIVGQKAKIIKVTAPHPPRAHTHTRTS